MDGIDTSLNAKPRAAVRPADRAGADAPVAPVSAPAEAHRADSANLLSLIADAAPPIDTRKVDAIRALIGQGAYPIDARAIAAKMIALDVAAPRD